MDRILDSNSRQFSAKGNWRLLNMSQRKTGREGRRRSRSTGTMAEVKRPERRRSFSIKSCRMLSHATLILSSRPETRSVHSVDFCPEFCFTSLTSPRTCRSRMLRSRAKAMTKRHSQGSVKSRRRAHVVKLPSERSPSSV